MNPYLDPVFKHYADFKGRASKRKFWPFALLYILITLPIRLLDVVSEDSIPPLLAVLSLPLLLLTLALLIPFLAASTRRLHDVGRSGWWQLISFVPFGGLVLLYFYLQESEAGTNKWGPHPLSRGVRQGAVAAPRNDW